MFKFEARDEGYMVSDEDGRGVCDLRTREVGLDRNPELKKPKRTVKEFPRDAWTIHWCAGKFTAAQVLALAKEIAALPDKHPIP